MTESQVYFFAILTIGSLLHLLRQSLNNPDGKKGAYKHSAVRDLSPTEVAYLSKEGDSGFALLVLIFDILHREIKDKISGGAIEKFDDNQKHYELVVRQAVGGSLKDWSMRKIEAVAGNVQDLQKDPIRFAIKLPGLYKLIRSGLNDTVKQVFKDPRNIKKFVSIPGLLRLAAEIGASGYKTRLAVELKENLTDSGFLATDDRKKTTINYLLGTFIIGQLILLTLVLTTIPSQVQAVVVYLCAVVAAFVVQGCNYLRGFLPLYTELSQALSQVQTDNFRVNAIRTVLNIVTKVLNVLSIIGFVILFSTGSLFLYLTHAVTSFDVYLMLIALMIVQLIALQYLIDVHRLVTGELATGAAHRSLEELKRDYPQEDLLPAIKAFLGESDYGPELSYLIALYGLEALLLI